jgi:phosphoglycolate phosphatase
MEKAPTQELNPFQWKEFDAYLFDIDGTLLLSKDRTHRYALHRALLDVYGVETTIDGIAYHGKTDLGILRAALERAGVATDVINERMSQALEVVRQDASEKAERFTPDVLAGVREVLELLRSSGKLLGVASGNLELIGWLKIKAAGLSGFFEFGRFADNFEFREDVFRAAMAEVQRRLGASATVCFVGDTPDDVRAARSAGGRVIAVGTGIFKIEDLSCHGPDATIGCCSELLTL